MKRVSKVVLLCLMVLPMFVNADRRQDRRWQPRRESACTRACRILAASIFFLGGTISSSLAGVSLYRAYQAQTQMPKVVCNVGSDTVTLHSIEDACDERRVLPLMDNGVLRSGGQCYLHAQNWKYPLPRPEETLSILAKTGRERALEIGNYRLAEICLLYDKNNN